MNGDTAKADGRLPRDTVGRGTTRFTVKAERITKSARWSDIQLPPEELSLLHQIASQLADESTVDDQSGVRRKPADGLGISVLFSGASGTGKTLAAQVLANELHLPFYRVPLSA